MNDAIAEVMQVYQERGEQRYGTEDVTQLEHALQTATLAVDEGADATLISAALLHDIGHIREAQIQGAQNHQQNADEADRGNQSLDDRHEDSSYRWILEHFGKAVADPVRLHVVAKRYLCTKDSTYEKRLSPTSYASFMDQGGPMDERELAEFESEEYWNEALRLRHWDDTAKDPNRQTQSIESFVSYLETAQRAVGD